MRLVGVLLLCAVLMAQESPVLRVTTRLVEVNVVVTDKKGRLVEGLTKDDFLVLEDGKPQKITNFSMESNRILPKPAEPLPPGTFTNRYELKGAAPSSVTVILLDLLNTKIHDKTFARAQIVQFLGKHLLPGDRVALYALDSRLRLLYDFTGDATRLIRALDQYKSRAISLETYHHNFSGTGVPEVDQFLRQFEQNVTDMYTTTRIEWTAAALQGIANRVSALPGRKNLVWITGSVPFSLGLAALHGGNAAPNVRRSFNAEVERAARAMDAADLAVYPVNARGLLGVKGLGVEYRGSAQMGRSQPAMTLRDDTDIDRDAMRTMAQRTGGRAFMDSNDIASAIRTAVEDTRITYEIGYSPNHERWDGHFQKLKVNVNRPGATVRHRGGYFAFAEEQATVPSRQEDLRSVAASPLEATGVRMVVTLKPNVPAPGRLGVETTIELADLALTLQEGHWRGRLDVAYAMWSTLDTQIVTGSQDEVRLDLEPATYRKALDAGFTLHKELPIPDSAHRLKVIVRDPANGATGSVEIPITPSTGALAPTVNRKP
jgi:VWFA-related protein